MSTTIFLNDANNAISGVLFARRSIFNLLPTRARLTYLAHNPKAVARFPVAALPVRGEVWVDGDRLAHVGVVSHHGVLARRPRYPTSIPR